MVDSVPMGKEFQAVLDRLAADPPAIREPQTANLPALQTKHPHPATLPIWGKDKRGAPNSFLRSSLFAAVQGQHRRQMKHEVLFGYGEISIIFTGEQLNQSDLDVWEALINLAREQPLGTQVCFSTHGLLKSLKLSTGKRDYTWFDEVIVRLTGAHVQVNHGKQKYGGTLIHEWFKDEENGRYKIVMNEKLINLYGPTQWTAIDWSQRLQLRKRPLAQSLHAFYSTHETPYPLKLTTLRGIAGSQNTHMPSFRRQIALALAKLVSIKFLTHFEFRGELVAVDRADPKSA
jgi:hypothetical protein